MSQIPEKLQEALQDFDWITDRLERQQYLIEIADRFPDVRVPETIATQPYPEENHIQECESDAYVWATENTDGTLKYYFDVLNPQGLSAMAIAVLLEENLSGQPLEQVVAVNPEIVFTLFGKGVSMGKGQGLMGIVRRVQYLAKKHMEAS